MGTLVNVDSGPVSGDVRRAVDASAHPDQNQVVLMKTTLSAGPTLRSAQRRRAPRISAAGLLAVADGLTRPGLRAAAVRVRRLFGGSVPGSAAGGAEGPAEPARSSGPTLVGGPNLRFYHRAGCPMAAGREWDPAPAAEHSRAGRAPCGMCRP
jgi:hypothetical protein